MKPWPGGHVLAFVGLLLLRALLITSPGYLHPDEFFQSPEVFAVATPAQRAWEFRPEHALRTPVFPWLFSHCAQSVSQKWWAPRLVPLALSVLVDLFVWHASGRSWTHVLLYASSWPALLLQSRSFSNGIEAVGVALVGLLAGSPVAVGLVGAAVLFARFTFPAFAAGLIPLPPHRKAIVGAVLMSLVFVAADSHFYGRLTVTPWNALRYNMRTENVAQHGLHPRVTHALVNMPLLLGPMMVLQLRPRAVWLLPLAVLSLSPHQEPRFLLPLVAPAMATSAARQPSPLQWGLHVTFHVIATTFFGYFHQAGIVPSLLEPAPPQSGHLVYWKTYPPPPHLCHPRDRNRIVDLQGAPEKVLLNRTRPGDWVVAPFHLMEPMAGFELQQCWGPHLSTENLTPDTSKWKLCRWQQLAKV